MLEIVIPGGELYDSENNYFIRASAATIQLEHSLVSISKWESRWEKSFFGDGKTEHSMTAGEFRDYVRCMTLTESVDPEAYLFITEANQQAIVEYMKRPMTATTFGNTKKDFSRKILTSEEIYWQMIALGIPFECQYWHINRLMTLIRICSIKQNKPEKVPMKETIAQRNALNKLRQAQFNSKG